MRTYAQQPIQLGTSIPGSGAVGRCVREGYLLCQKDV